MAQTLRQTYLHRLNQAIYDLDADISGLTDDIDRMEEKIGETTLPHQPLFSSEDHFWAEVANGNFDAEKIQDQAWDRVDQELFRGDLAGYDFHSLPFPATRSITHLEKVLHSRFVEQMVLEEHDDCLHSQFEDIRYFYYHNPMADGYDCDSGDEYWDGATTTMATSTAAPTTKTVDKEESERLGKLALSEIETMGFPKTRIVADLKSMIDEVEAHLSREEKIAISRKIFRYLATPYGKKFVKGYERFQKTVEEKLLHFRYIEGLREAGTWWRQIFGTRMPLEGETN